MIISTVQNTRNNSQKSRTWVKPINANKNGQKQPDVECSYQMLQKQAMMAYQK